MALLLSHVALDLAPRRARLVRVLRPVRLGEKLLAQVLLDGLLHAALRAEQELAAGHDLLAGRESCEHLHVALARGRAQLERARLEAAFAECNEASCRSPVSMMASRGTRTASSASFECTRAAALYALRNSERQTQVFEVRILLRVEQVVEVARQSYAAGASSFTDLIETQRTLKRAQELGFSLREIKELLALDEDADCADVRAKANAKLDDIDRKIENLKRMRKALARLRASCRGRGDSAVCPILNSLRINSR